MTTIIPKLGLNDLRDSDVAVFALDKVEKLTGNANFPNPVPSVADVQAKIQQYGDALAKAEDGSKADTAHKNDVRAELELLLRKQAQNCADTANGDLAKYLSSGYSAKDTKGQPTGALPQVENLSLAFGDNEGELKLKWNSTPDASNYTWQVYVQSSTAAAEGDPVPGIDVLSEGISQKSKTTVSNLTPGKKVWVRVRANGGTTAFGPWSDPAEKRVP